MTHITGEKSLFKYGILIHEPFGVVLQKDSKRHNVTALSILCVTETFTRQLEKSRGPQDVNR